MRLFKTITSVALLLWVAGCAGPVVKTDLETYLENPGDFEGKQVIFITEISSVVDDLDAYRGKRVELSGNVEYVGFWASSYWNFLLKDGDDVSIKCYERNYHHYAWIMPVNAMKRAERDNGIVTVVGRVESGPKLELDWIEYEGQEYNTDYRPANIPIPFR